MQSGILVQHGHIPKRSGNVVRCDITAIIGFVPRQRWPQGCEKGDFQEIVLRQERELWAYQLRDIFDPPTRRAVGDFFVNGGKMVHLFGVCIDGVEDIISPLALDTVMGSLLDRLRAEEDLAIVTIPLAAYLPCEMTTKGEIHCQCEALYSFFLSHCNEMNNRFLIMDAPRGLHDDLLLRWVNQFRRRNQKSSSYGALYYPWLCDKDEMFPPSASIAGLYVRVENEHPPIGIQWPPANVLVHGVTHLEVELEWDESNALAEQHINPLVVQSGRGIVVFGVRTLSSNPIFQYINSRRILNLIVEQLRRDNEWAVFETHNPHLWSVLDRDIRYRLETFWQAGLLTMGNNGRKYEVTCNATNNPSHLRDAGMVNVAVQVQPVGSTEQIMIDLNFGAST